MGRHISDYSLRHIGCGFWLQDNTLSGKMFTNDFDSKISTYLKEILSKPNSSEFLISGLKNTFLPESSAKVFCIQGEPFDTYIMLSPQRNEMIWCEIHVHSLPAPSVFIRKMLQNPGDCPANYYLTESLPGLKLYAISPPQSEYFAINRNDYGIAIIATSIKTHLGSDHSHEPGEKESGMLVPTANAGTGKHVDDVSFHGEVVDLKEFNFYGYPVWKIECKLDFGDKGELTLPIFVLPMQQDFKEQFKKGEYVLGIGNLQLFQISKTDSGKPSQDDSLSEIRNNPDSGELCNRKPWWKFWEKKDSKLLQGEMNKQGYPSELKVGGIYSVIQGNREFRIAKLLVLEEGIAHIRLYKNKFSKRPDEINLSSLTLGTIHDKDGFGMEHLPIPERDFLFWQPELLVQIEVKEDELEGYKIFKENNGIPFHF